MVKNILFLLISLCFFAGSLAAKWAICMELGGDCSEMDCCEGTTCMEDGICVPADSAS